MRKSTLTILLALLSLGLAFLTAGCTALFPTEETTILGETLTPTPNETQKAIALMLTETRAAPTITLTRVVTATLTPTPTATTPPEGSSERPAVIGQPVTLAGAALTVLSAGPVDTVGRLKSDKTSALFDIEVIIENRSDAEMDYTPLYFRLQDQAGNAHQPESSAVSPALQSGTLKPGEWVRGHMLFLLPAGTGAQRLSYAPEVAPNQTATLWVDLSQSAVTAELPKGGPIATTQPLPGPGQRVESDGIALTIQMVTSSQRVAQTKAGKGNVLLVLNVTVENVSRTKTPVNPQYFMVKDPQGYEYPAVIIPAESLLQAGSLGEHQRVSGDVLFEIPAGTSQVVVEYQPQVLMEAYPQIRIQIQVPAAK
jgi:hypothetical protein